MTTDTPDLDEQEATPRRAPAADEQAPRCPRPEPVRFWQRPYVERYLVPFVLPILVVGGVVMFILNISRIFLSTHGNVDVVVGTGILLDDPHRRVVARRVAEDAHRLARAHHGRLRRRGDDVRLARARNCRNPKARPGRRSLRKARSAYALTFESSNALKFTPDAGTRPDRHRRASR